MTFVRMAICSRDYTLACKPFGRPGEPSAQSLPNQAAAIEDVHLPVVPEP